jgi:hypothetical protein
MEILPPIKLPTPFGKEISLPALETPPLELPSMPDERGRRAIGHGLGQDLAQVIGIVPWVGDLLHDMLEDMHQAEINKILTAEELKKFNEYNKVLPSSVAMARIFCFSRASKGG